MPTSRTRFDASSHGGTDETSTFVSELARVFREQVQRAVGMELDGTSTSLAVVDHYLGLARGEDRPEILSLLAAGAGAYFSQVVSSEIGAHVLDDRKDPRRIRVLLEPRCCHFSPVDLAYAAIVADDLSPDDPRHPPGRPLDLAFHLRTDADDGPSDAAWIEARLAELPPVPADTFHTLTCRFETLELICELLAARDAAAGRSPAPLAIEDYARMLAGDGR
ncbi:MAG: hypothetical protein D6705_17290 [Deltaproteobacteria bacterium]|nr:MAG: hypothetical protein D6705_17290 [Deltaproteobacteria bacterium]